MKTQVYCSFTPSNNEIQLYGETIISLLKLIALTDEFENVLIGPLFPYFNGNEIRDKIKNLFEIFGANLLDGIIEWLKTNAELTEQILT